MREPSGVTAIESMSVNVPIDGSGVPLAAIRTIRPLPSSAT